MNAKIIALLGLGGLGAYLLLKPGTSHASALPKMGEPGGPPLPEPTVPGAKILVTTDGKPFSTKSPPSPGYVYKREDIRVGDLIGVDVQQANWGLPEIPSGNVALKVTAVDASEVLRAVSVDPRLAAGRVFSVPRQAIIGISPGDE